MQVRVDVLGPLRLVLDGDEVIVPGPKRRLLLAVLATGDGRAVSSDALLEALWPGGLPDTARATLQSHVSRRHHLGPASDRLQQVSGGYRLELGPDGTDLAQARDLFRTARSADPRQARDLLGRARALWRGEVLVEFAHVGTLMATAVTAAELRRAIDEAFLVALVDAGDHEQAVEAAIGHLADEPLCESAVLVLMRALHGQGRTADALRAGYEHRRRVITRTGIEPTGALGALEADLAAEATPPSGAVPRSPHRLRGRDVEVAALRRLLSTERMVTVVGPGGVGKTRLASEIAGGVEPATAVLLSPITDDRAVPQAVADALDLRIIHGDALSACAALLGAGARLLFIDNCEHLLEGVRRVVQHLIDECPQLTVLATSREPLGLPAEQRLRLAPLSVAEPTDLDELERSPAVELFVDRATRLQPEFALDPEQLTSVTEIVRRLDGLPLAIELAAARLPVLGLADLHARIDQALDLLGDGSDGTLRQAIRWSYDLLPESEQRVLRHISVFPDGLDLTTAETVASALDPESPPLKALAHLVDASMLQRSPGSTTRYRMLDTVRAFAGDELTRLDEFHDATGRFIRWALDLASWIYDVAYTHGEHDVDLALRRELPNLRSAWGLLRSQGRTGDAISMIAGLLDAATWRDVTEVWEWSLELAADPVVRNHPDGAVALGLAAASAWFRGELDLADTLAAAGTELAGAEEWTCVDARSLVALSRGDLDAAIADAVAAGDAAPRPTQSYGIAALASAYRGDLDAARALNDRFSGVAASPTLEAFHLYVTGEIEALAGHCDDALTCYGASIDRARSVGSTFVEGVAAVGRLSQLAAAGQTNLALIGFRDLIDYWERTGSWVQQWTTVRNLADILDEVGGGETAFFLRAAAAFAPDAPPSPVHDERSARDLDARTTIRLRAHAASVDREHLLHIARDAIDAALDRQRSDA